MRRPIWASILRQIYLETEPIEYPPDELSTANPLLKNTGFTREEVANAIKKLKKCELIKYEIVKQSDGKNPRRCQRELQLTDSGFKRAHEQELSYQEASSNDAIKFFTYGLVIIGALELIQKLGSPLRPVEVIAMLFVLLVLIAISPHVLNQELKPQGVNRWVNRRKHYLSNNSCLVEQIFFHKDTRPANPDKLETEETVKDTDDPKSEEAIKET